MMTKACLREIACQANRCGDCAGCYPALRFENNFEGKQRSAAVLALMGRNSRILRHFKYEANDMFLLLAIILLILWVGGFFVMHISSFLIHLLIIFAVISLVIHLISGRKG